MNPDIPTISRIVDLTIFVTLVGLAVRGRWRLILFFTPYLAAILARDILMTFWPERFYFQRFWLVGQSVLDILKFGIALEVGWRTFGAFPGAASVARKATVVILGLTAVSVASLPLATPESTVFETAITSFHPRLNDGTIWLMAAILAIAKWYHVPLHRFHAAVVTSLALYLFFFTSALRLYAGRDYEITRHYFNLLDPIGFLLVTCWWVRIACGSENGGDRIHVDTVKALHLRSAAAASGPSL